MSLPIIRYNVIDYIAILSTHPIKIQCWDLFLLLRKRYYSFILVEPYYNGDHIISKIGNNYYDIDGIVSDIRGYQKLEDKLEIERLGEGRKDFYQDKVRELKAI